MGYSIVHYSIVHSKYAIVCNHIILRMGDPLPGKVQRGHAGHGRAGPGGLQYIILHILHLFDIILEHVVYSTYYIIS